MAAGSMAQGPLDETPLATRMLRRLRPREGWLIVTLAWAATASLPAATAEGQLLAGISVTLLLSTLGLIFGWWAGHRPWRGVFVSVASLLAGILTTLIWGVYVFNPLPSALQIGRWLDWGVACGIRPGCHLPAPALNALQEQAARLAEFAQRVGWWVNGAITGQGIPDNLVLVGFAALLAWLLAAWSGWWIARHGRVFLALFPTGFLLPQQVYNADVGLTWLLTFLVALAALLVLSNMSGQERAWERAGVDYSEELRMDNTLAAALIAIGVLILSPLLPALSPRSISEAFWRTFEAPYRQVEQQVARSFPGVESRRSLVPPFGVAPGGLPRAHLLGGRPELKDEIALRVQVRGVPGGAPLYWRGQTFAFYNGHGWQADQSPYQPEKPLSLAAGQPWTDVVPPLRRNVLVSVQVEEATRAVLYAAGEPISVDRPYEATLRAPGELVALSAPGSPNRYTVLGAVPDVSPVALRTAGSDYPPVIADLYLQLPPDLPAALTQTATAMTAGAQTPYDKALAIETALRKLPYTLDVPAPPPDREVVSWFLYDLKKGYCDYFASAMVVLARLSGVPARLAVGYASGAYDPRTERYVVTELDAHSWPEVYFPGYGWIPFEPTPARPVPNRTSVAIGPTAGLSPDMGYGDLNTGLAELRQLGAVQAAAEGRNVWGSRVAGGLSLLLGLSQALALFWLGQRAWAETVGDYDRLARWGRRLGRAAHAWETPREYALRVAAAADDIVRGWTKDEGQRPKDGVAYLVAVLRRRERGRLDDANTVIQSDSLHLTAAYESSLYAPPPSEPRVNEDQRWAALWAALRRLWLAKWWR